MSAIPGLKKKLKSVRATGKLSKAMKTVAAAKFGRLSTAWKTYARYEEQYRFLFAQKQEEAADAVVVLGSNRGFCGGFNNDILTYFRESVPERNHLILCGEELIRVFREEGISAEKTFCFADVPQFSDCQPLMEHLMALAGEKKDFRVRLVCPEYINTMTQTPASVYVTINCETADGEDGGWLWLPEREPVMAALYEKGAKALIYGALLKTALGAQASTLMTMRSAYDTATEYTEALEGEIHRLRQTEVTADVIETSSERGVKGEKTNG